MHGNHQSQEHQNSGVKCKSKEQINQQTLYDKSNKGKYFVANIYGKSNKGKWFHLG